MNHPKTTSRLPDHQTRLSAAYQKVRQQLLDNRQDGHWVGQLSSSALSTATAISTLAFYRDDPGRAGNDPRVQLQIESGIRWLVNQQNDDGGFGDTKKSYSNISTTLLVIAALNAAGVQSRYSDVLQSAQTYVDSLGGVEGLRARYGKDKTFAVPILANCAMAGVVSWKEVSSLPFYAACVPQKFYNLMQLPVVSYAIPALVAIGQAKFILDPPWDPVRKMIGRACIAPSLRVLEKMLPASGGFLEAVPLTSFVSMALVKSGRADHPVVQAGIQFILDSFRVENERVSDGVGDLDGDVEPVDAQSLHTHSFGSWPIDTNLATWATTLSINALSNCSSEFSESLASPDSAAQWETCIRWVLDCQNTKVHPFTGAEPGGWGWTDLTGSVPDADDTPGALIALRHVYDQLNSVKDDGSIGSKTVDGKILQSKTVEDLSAKILAAKDLGLNWLLNLQNRDKGWPTFCRGWGKLPFDKSGTDITAHAIRGLLAWQDVTSDSRIQPAIDSGFAYLRKTQQKNGSWLPLWFGNQDVFDDENPCYGTAKVLMAFIDANAFDTHEAEIGLKWIRENQNPDGGFGGGKSVTWNNSKLGCSSVEETALCTEALLNHDDQRSRLAANRGVQWLIEAVESSEIESCSPIGFYFFKLWYYEKLYPLIFATSTLGRAIELKAY